MSKRPIPRRVVSAPTDDDEYVGFTSKTPEADTKVEKMGLPLEQQPGAPSWTVDPTELRRKHGTNPPPGGPKGSAFPGLPNNPPPKAWPPGAPRPTPPPQRQFRNVNQRPRQQPSPPKPRPAPPPPPKGRKAAHPPAGPPGRKLEKAKDRFSGLLRDERAFHTILVAFMVVIIVASVSTVVVLVDRSLRRPPIVETADSSDAVSSEHPTSRRRAPGKVPETVGDDSWADWSDQNPEEPAPTQEDEDAETQDHASEEMVFEPESDVAVPAPTQRPVKHRGTSTIPPASVPPVKQDAPNEQRPDSGEEPQPPSPDVPDGLDIANEAQKLRVIRYILRDMNYLNSTCGAGNSCDEAQKTRRCRRAVNVSYWARNWTESFCASVAGSPHPGGVLASFEHARSSCEDPNLARKATSIDRWFERCSTVAAR